MRRLILVLLIALLPLRGWTAERVTIDMATVELGMNSTMMAMDDCPMKKGHDGSDASWAGHGCQSCQLCMSIAAPELPLLDFSAPAPGTALLAPAEGFRSADLARAAKPPIS